MSGDDTFHGFGTDVRSHRRDELDDACIQAVAELLVRPGYATVVDLGCGRFAQDRALLALGAAVVAVDLDCSLRTAVPNPVEFDGRLNFFGCDMRNTGAYLAGLEPNCLYSQRALHYLPYAHAGRVLCANSQRMKAGSQAFLSVSGIGSELANGYSGLQNNVRDRFTPLSDAMGERHGIRRDVCLYSPDEFAQLLVDSGLEPQRIWLSEFGNVKAIARKGLNA